MIIARTRDDLNQTLQKFTQKPGKLALIPTMGNLHDGHLSLVRLAKLNAKKTITTIFVNPLQFGPNEDLDVYPRTLDQDLKHLETISCDAVFCPAPDFAKNAIKISANSILSKKLCGISRPHFFDGVITILNHFFQLIKRFVGFLEDRFLVVEVLVLDHYWEFDDQ